MAVVVLLMFTSVTVFSTWRGTTKYFQFRGFYSGLVEPYADGVFGNDLVFVSGAGDFGSAMVLNHPSLPNDSPIFLRDIDAATNARAMAAFPERTNQFVELNREGIVFRSGSSPIANE